MIIIVVIQFKFGEDNGVPDIIPPMLENSQQ